AAIGIYAPYHQRQHLKGLRKLAGGERKAPGDVFKVQTIRLVLAFDLLDELQPELAFGHSVARTDDQVALSPHRHHAVLGAPVPIGIGKILDGHARHEELEQDAAVDDLYRPRAHA